MQVSVIVPANAVTIETMRASGPGGQNVNKRSASFQHRANDVIRMYRSSAVRMTHKETGIAVHVMDERYQHMNMQVGMVTVDMR